MGPLTRFQVRKHTQLHRVSTVQILFCTVVCSNLLGKMVEEFIDTKSNHDIISKVFVASNKKTATKHQKKSEETHNRVSTMSLNRKANQLSNVVNHVPAKRAKQTDNRCKKRWDALEPFLNMASKDQVVEILAKKLFKELYKTNGDKAVTDIISSVMKKHKMNKNRHLADTAWIFEGGPSLNFQDGVQSATLFGLELPYCADEINLVLQSSNGADVLNYEGDVEGSYRRGFDTYPGYKVYLSSKYDPSSDTIEVNIEANAYSPTPLEEEFEFTGKREEVSDESDFE